MHIFINHINALIFLIANREREVLAPEINMLDVIRLTIGLDQVNVRLYWIRVYDTTMYDTTFSFTVRRKHLIENTSRRRDKSRVQGLSSAVL